MGQASLLLEKLLHLYECYFDINRQFETRGTIYDAYAFSSVSSAGYALVKKAELWRAYTYEHVFFQKTDVFSSQELQKHEKQLREQTEPEFVREGEKYPKPNHMCTYLTGIFLCRKAVSEETVRQIRRHKFRRNYCFALRGYCESRLLVFDLENGKLYGNAAAKSLVKNFRRQFIREGQK